MTDQTKAYAEVLADLERDRDGINAAIDLIRRKMGLTAEQSPAPPKGVPNGGSGAASDQPSEIKPDTFFGLKVPDAIKLYLTMTKRPARASVITKAILEGGLQSTSTNFPANVQTALTRMKGEVVRVPNGWGLIEWYPGRSFDKAKPSKKASEDHATD